MPLLLSGTAFALSAQRTEMIAVGERACDPPPLSNVFRCSVCLSIPKSKGRSVELRSPADQTASVQSGGISVAISISGEMSLSDEFST